MTSQVCHPGDWWLGARLEAARLEDGRRHRRAEPGLWEQLDALASARGSRTLAWHYVRGHVGIPGNERVDAMADSFAVQKPVALYDGPLSGYPVPILDLPDDTTALHAARPRQARADPPVLRTRTSAWSTARRCVMPRGASARGG